MENLSKTKNFAIFISIFYIFGILSAFYHIEIPVGFIAFILLLVLIFVFNFGFKKSILLYLIFFSGVIRVNMTTKFDCTLDNLNTSDAKVYGQVVSSKDVSLRNKRVKFYLRAEKVNVFNKEIDGLNTKMLVNTDIKDDIDKKIKIGDYIELEGKLRTPKPSSNPYQFDYQNYLLRNGVKNILYADPSSFKKLKEAQFVKNKKESWYWLLAKFETTRNKILEKHSKNIKSPRLEVLGGIVFGNETINPDEKIKENFKNSGLLHLLAASGLNVALIFGIWWRIATLIRFPYNASILMGALFVMLYTFMTGFPPSILRASIMLLFVLFGKIIDREVNSISLIFFVAFLILFFNPAMFFDVGFELSFVVTFGLVAFCPVVVEKFKKIDEKYVSRYKKENTLKRHFYMLFTPVNLISIVLVPLVAQIFVIPLQMYYFNNFAPFSILANIAVVPFIGILSFVGFVSSFFALIPRLSDFMVKIFDFIANPLLGLLIKISEFFSSFKISLISTMGLNLFQMFGFWGLILLFLYNIKCDFKNKKLLLTFLVCTLIFLLSFINFDKFSSRLEIIMFDVDNADSFLIKTPKNKYIMIDTGRLPYKGLSSAQNILNKYFKNKRISSLELLIITHFDSDHSGGAIDVMDNIKIKEVIIQKEDTKTKLANDIIKYLKKNKLNYKIASNNEVVYEEQNLTLSTFHADIDNSDNESSIASLLKYKDKNILFMADIGTVGFSQFEKYIPNNIDILKVGHHGAKGVLNQKMIDKLHPKYALISAGTLGRFVHPHYSTIVLLNENSIKTISTKNYGFVKILPDKNDKEFQF